MAGEPSLYLVYKDFTTDERTGVSWHGTQAAADAAATASGAGFTAHQGAITVPNHFTPGLIYNPTLDTWRQLAVSDLDELGQRKAAATELYANLDSQEYDLDKRMRTYAGKRPGGRYPSLCAMGLLQHLYRLHLHRRATDDLGNRDVDRAIGCCGPRHADTEVQRLDRCSSSDNDLRLGVSGRRRALCNGGAETASGRWNAAIGDLTTFNPGNRAWIEDIT